MNTDPKLQVIMVENGARSPIKGTAVPPRLLNNRNVPAQRTTKGLTYQDLEHNEASSSCIKASGEYRRGHTERKTR